MPHVRGLAAHHARRNRARDRGFLREHPPGLRSLLVPLQVVEQVRTMVKSLELHRVHDVASGGISHFARLATRAAASCGAITEQENQVALKTHRAANAAKHEVSRGAPRSSSFPPSAKWADQESSSSDDAAVVDVPDADPLVACDPWAHASFTPKKLIVGSPPLDPWASWSPVSEACSLPVAVVDPFLASVEKALLSITVVAERLSGKLEICLDRICGRLAAAPSLVADCGGALADESTSTAADEGLLAAGAAQVLEGRIAKLEEAACHRIDSGVSVLAGFEVALRSEMEAFSHSLVSRTTSCTSSLLKKYDAGIQVLFADLRLSIAPPASVVGEALLATVVPDGLLDNSQILSAVPESVPEAVFADVTVEEPGSPVGWSSPPIVQHAFLEESAVVQYARLSGLRSTRLNGLPGIVAGLGVKPGCWQVFLHNDPVPKSVPGHNLVRYCPSSDNICSGCLDQYRVDTVPKCGCGFESASDSARGDEHSDGEDHTMAEAIASMSFDEWSSACAVQNPFGAHDGDVSLLGSGSSSQLAGGALPSTIVGNNDISTPTAGDSSTTTTKTEAAFLAGSAWSEARPGTSGVPGLTIFR
eukprot:CAMPEP_0203873742 /NCGR_PEP_ID=MMETSP0359-20131031/19903_1 /ASSEMBLY_ACC=CAM_ASM_000338 /TAXON_ID=268821 /ORGANISM="Scrippsiella Hangoei, Strain SHTV-5" /LENGTH=590 /DNA_ID=CAMNT_0050792445 /DNA_START=60 /DNA_END=1832 /DNA_ORIENTATION=-